MIQLIKENFNLFLTEYIKKNFALGKLEKNPLHPVLEYALSGKGKHVRPLLCLLAADALGGEISQSLFPALAIEFLHTYSLIHDDLPAMDNDSLRRGRPTLHIQFDEARAILAGDALLTDAFSILSSPDFVIKDHLKIKLIHLLSLACGSSGMIYGQALDIECEKKKIKDVSLLETLHLNKTGKLIAASCQAGALVSQNKNNLDQKTLDSFYEFGLKIGYAFQLQDDLIDDSPHTGKSQGKDRKQEKLTVLDFYSRFEIEKKVTQLTEEAISFIENTSPKTFPLIKFVKELIERKS